MGVHEATNRLEKAHKQLLARWQEARQMWDDAAAARFESEHLQPWSLDLRRAATALGHVAHVLASVRNDCL